MTIKKGLFFAFAALIIFVPIYVAVSSQNVLNNGKLYKFKPISIDRYDPFRGDFLRVNYKTGDIKTKFHFDERETAYVTIAVDDKGFAFFDEALKSPPKNKVYLKTTIQSLESLGLVEEIDRAIEEGNFDIKNLDSRSSVRIKIPDNMSKFFISDAKAYRAEDVLGQEQGSSYIGVRVLDGQARIDEIYVHDQPILEYLDTKGKK